MESLNSISSKNVRLGFDTELKEAVMAAESLKIQFQQAFNQETGRLDLSKLNKSINAGEMNLEKYRIALASIGPEGEKAFLQVAAAINKAQTPALNMGKHLDELWITMKNTMRWQITSSAMHSFIGGLESAYGYAQDLNESLNNIRIVTSKSTDDMSRFAKEANEAAKLLSTTTVAYTDAALIYYQQGDTDEQVLEKTRVTIEAANAAGTSAAQMSEYLTAVWNSYQAGSDELESFVDKMSAVGAATASSLEEISTAMTKVAATANTVGVDFDQLTSIVATVASVTRNSPETVGTAFKTIFARIGDLAIGETMEDGLNLGAVSSKLQKVGVDVLDVNGDLREMGTVIEEIGAKWQNWTTAQRTAIAQAIAGRHTFFCSRKIFLIAGSSLKFYLPNQCGNVLAA